MGERVWVGERVWGRGRGVGGEVEKRAESGWGDRCDGAECKEVASNGVECDYNLGFVLVERALRRLVLVYLGWMA